MRKIRTRKLAIEQISKKLKDHMISSRELDELAEEDTVRKLFIINNATSCRLFSSFLEYLNLRTKSIIGSAKDGELIISPRELKRIVLLHNVLGILSFNWDPKVVYVNQSNYDRFVSPSERTSDAYKVEIDLRCRKAINVLRLLFERGLNKWYLGV